MAQVTLTIGGRDYPVQCHDGEEPHIRRLAGLVDAKAQEAGSGAALGETRQLLFAALMLADQLVEGSPPTPPAIDDDRLDKIADRVERLALALEKLVPNA